MNKIISAILVTSSVISISACGLFGFNNGPVVLEEYRQQGPHHHQSMRHHATEPMVEPGQRGAVKAHHRAYNEPSKQVSSTVNKNAEGKVERDIMR